MQNYKKNKKKIIKNTCEVKSNPKNFKEFIKEEEFKEGLVLDEIGTAAFARKHKE